MATEGKGFAWLPLPGHDPSLGGTEAEAMEGHCLLLRSLAHA